MKKLLLLIILFSFLHYSAYSKEKDKKEILEKIDAIDLKIFKDIYSVFDMSNINAIQQELDFFDENKTKKMNRCKKKILDNYITSVNTFIYYSDFRLTGTDEWSVYYEPKQIHIYLNNYIKARDKLKKRFKLYK